MISALCQFELGKECSVFIVKSGMESCVVVEGKISVLLAIKPQAFSPSDLFYQLSNRGSHYYIIWNNHKKSNMYFINMSWFLFQVFGDRILGVMNVIIPIGVALSTFGCALSIQFSVTRLCYVAAREGHMLEVFSYIHIKRLTPAPAVVSQVSYIHTLNLWCSN